MKVQGLNDIIKVVKANVHKDVAVRNALTDLLPVYIDRIFNNRGSKDAKGTALGNYTPSYVKFRRKKNWTGRKIILQLTGQMKNDVAFLVIKDGAYGFGFHNKANFDKADYVQDTYETIIFDDLTSEENRLLDKLILKNLDEGFKGFTIRN